MNIGEPPSRSRRRTSQPDVGHGSDDPAIRRTLFSLLDRRAPGATLCPSEVARALASDPVAWRALMPEVRRVAAQLVTEGRLRVTRQGVDVDATSPGGPIRLGRPR